MTFYNLGKTLTIVSLMELSLLVLDFTKRWMKPWFIYET